MHRLLILFTTAVLAVGCMPAAAQQAVLLDNKKLQAAWEQKITPAAAAELLNKFFDSTAIPPGLASDIEFLRHKFSRRTRYQQGGWTQILYREFNALARYAALLQMRSELPQVPLLLVGSASGDIPPSDCIPLKNISTFPEWKAVRGTVFQAIIAALPGEYCKGLSYNFSKLTAAGGRHYPGRIDYHSLRYQFSDGKWHCRKELVGNPGYLNDGPQFYLLEISLGKNMPRGIYYGTVKITTRIPGSTSELNYKLKVN